MNNKMSYSDEFLKSLNVLTGLPIRKIQSYAKENNLFNILEHPMVVDPNEKQMEKINKLNEFISSYSLLRMEEQQYRIKFNSPTESGKYFVSLLGGMKDRERFIVSFLDNSNSIIETKMISEGGVAAAVVYPRDILKQALATDCASILLSHNHPGGSTTPSREDIALTQRIVNIFKPLDIRVIDHIVVGGMMYSSMAQNQQLPDSALEEANYAPIVLKNHQTVKELETDYDENHDEVEM